jgi:arabinoxylan arabinofuranohydrolase
VINEEQAVVRLLQERIRTKGKSIMKIKNRNVSVLITLLLSSLCFADNPLVPDVGMADPHIDFYDGKFWVFTGHDADKASTAWVMPDWRIFSSEDLISWTLEGTISPTQNYMDDQSTKCCAGDATFRNGIYYWYFSNHNIDVGVMTATQPQGPYQDPLGKALLPKDLTPTREFDPTVFQDDDANQTPYIIFGTQSDAPYHIARLNEDMISLAETPTAIKKEGHNSGTDKNYLHKRNGVYYLSYGAFYATSKNIYGPYQFQGRTGTKYDLDLFAHGSFIEHKGQWFHIWCRYLDRTKNKFRECIMSYVHYKEDGSLVTDTAFLDAHYATGVGQYDAAWDKIEAEWYFESSGVEKRESAEGGFEIQDCDAGDYLYFPNVNNVRENADVSFRLSSTNAQPSSQIEVRQDHPSGKLLGTCVVPDTGGQKKYQTLSCSLTNRAGSKNLYLVFKGVDNMILNLDWFSFNK